MQSILLATDFSERSDRALRRAVILAQAHDAALHIVHVVDDDRPPRTVDRAEGEARQMLADLVRSLKDMNAMACTTQVLRGNPFVGLVKASDATLSDMLIIGPHRRHALRDIFAGTTAERTIRGASCPMLMVNGPPVGPWRRILVTTDLSDTAEAALKRFSALRLGAEAEISVLKVFEAPALRLAMSDRFGQDREEDYVKDLRNDAREALAAFMWRAGIRHGHMMLRPRDMPIAHEIVRAAEDLKADLIVVGTQGKSAIASMVMGSVCEQVLRNAPCDVLAIPPLKA